MSNIKTFFNLTLAKRIVVAFLFLLSFVHVFMAITLFIETRDMIKDGSSSSVFVFGCLAALALFVGAGFLIFALYVLSQSTQDLSIKVLLILKLKILIVKT